MDERLLPWMVFAAYLIAIGALVWHTRRAATTMESFAVGNRTASPIFVGLSLAANMTSVATFVINPGLVYAYGWAGVVGYGLAAPLGIFLGLVVTTTQFRRFGDRTTSLTVPQWLGERYGSAGLRVLMAVASLLQVTFLVLIVTALTLVLMSVLGLSMAAAVAVVVLVGFGVVFWGGAAVHVRSNTVQGMTMMVVALLLVGSGVGMLGDGLGTFVDRLRAVAPHYASVTNPASLLFRDLFEVVVANFVVGVAIIMQPHIMSKALYLRSERDVRRYLGTAIVVGTLFTAVLLVGLFARLEMGGGLAPDQVVPTYIVEHFPPALRAVIMLGVLAAGFSTLEGIALALSAIVANDVVAVVARARSSANPAAWRRGLPWVGRGVLVALAPVTAWLAVRQIVSPSLSVAIFAQNGVYALFAATFAPVVFGLFTRRPRAGTAIAAAVVALAVHFGMYYGQITHYHNNPAVPATCALLAGLLTMAAGGLLTGRRA